MTDVDAALRSLESLGTKTTRDGMARYGIVAKKAFGVPVGQIKALGKSIGRDHELALALWETEWYEARMLTSFVDDPARVTVAQMDRWCRDFDNWGIVDTVCFHLFDRTPHAFGRIAAWSTKRDEFGKRAAFALLACVAAHDKKSDDARFVECLPLIERAAADDRNFVKKGVSWALRMVGRRSRALYAASIDLSHRLASAEESAARWIGRDALRDLEKPAVARKLR